MSQVLDIILLIICVFFAIRAYIKGFLSEFFALLAFIGGFFIAYKFSPTLIELIPKNETLSKPVVIVVYGVTFLLTYILIKVIEKQLNHFINLILLTGLNKIMGLLFGLIEAVVIISLLVYIIRNQDIIEFDFAQYLEGSRVLEYIDSIVTTTKDSLNIK